MATDTYFSLAPLATNSSRCNCQAERCIKMATHLATHTRLNVQSKAICGDHAGINPGYDRVSQRENAEYIWGYQWEKFLHQDEYDSNEDNEMVDN